MFIGVFNNTLELFQDSYELARRAAEEKRINQVVDSQYGALFDRYEADNKQELSTHIQEVDVLEKMPKWPYAAKKLPPEIKEQMRVEGEASEKMKSATKPTLQPTQMSAEEIEGIYAQIRKRRVKTPVIVDQNAAKSCKSCDTTKTPQWRNGPEGQRTLCNSCNWHYKVLLSEIKVEREKEEPAALRTKPSSQLRPSQSPPSMRGTKRKFQDMSQNKSSEALSVATLYEKARNRKMRQPPVLGDGTQQSCDCCKTIKTNRWHASPDKQGKICGACARAIYGIKKTFQK